MRLAPPPYTEVLFGKMFAPIWQTWFHEVFRKLDEQFVVKQTDESITNSTTLQDDDELQVELAANGAYDIEFFITWASVSTTPDVKYQFIEPDGTYELTGISNSNGAATARFGDEGTAAVALGIGAAGQAWLSGRILAHPSTAGGVFKLQWSPNAIDAVNPTICEANSWMRARKL